MLLALMIGKKILTIVIAAIVLTVLGLLTNDVFNRRGCSKEGCSGSCKGCAEASSPEASDVDG